jgi:hypothetical protein
MTLGGSCGGHATRGSGIRMCRKWTQVKESIIRSIKTSSFSVIISIIEIFSTWEGLELSSQLLSNDSNITMNQKKLNLSSMELNLVSSTQWNNNK